MNKIIISSALLIGLSWFTHAKAAEDCATKRAALEHELRVAEQYSNTYKIAGLRQALADVNTICTSDSVLAETQLDIHQYQEKVWNKQHDVAEIEHDLHQAEMKDDNFNIIKYQHKLEQKRLDLKDAQQKLAQAKREQLALNH